MIMNLEIEAKFQVDDLTAVRQTLLLSGAILENPRVYEKNSVYDDERQTLKNSSRLIRLRQDEKIKLTYKGAPPAQIKSDVKVREEIELEVSDFAKMEQIIGRLGYRPVLIYEKYRETFQLDGVEIVLDELPFGNFVEIEGSEPDIKEAANRIGLAWSQRININYLGLFQKVKVAYNLNFADLTFENFIDVEVDWRALRAD